MTQDLLCPGIIMVTVNLSFIILQMSNGDWTEYVWNPSHMLRNISLSLYNAHFSPLVLISFLWRSCVFKPGENKIFKQCKTWHIKRHVLNVIRLSLMLSEPKCIQWLLVGIGKKSMQNYGFWMKEALRIRTMCIPAFLQSHFPISMLLHRTQDGRGSFMRKRKREGVLKCPSG